jgi:glycosyltransferase involved in cell wall biosynthesis
VRVVICANTAWNLVNFRSGLIEALIGRGMEVVAVAPPDEANALKLRALGCRFEAVPMDNMGTSPLKDLALLIRFGRLFARLRPDVFLGFTVKPNIYGSFAARLCNVATINNISGLGTAFLREGPLNRIVGLLYAAALRGSRHVFFQNPDDRRLFLERRLAPSARTSILPGSGIDLDRFSPAPVESARPGGELRFLLIGRLLRDKGIVEYVDAAREVKKDYPGTSFTILGFLDVENRSAIDRQVLNGWLEKGVISYAGSTEDVRPHIRDADCVVLPSYREGTPRTLLEAAAMGKPIIATDVPGCRETVDEGENGYLCLAKSSVDLARQMRRMISLSPDERSAMGRKGREKVTLTFDQRKVVESYMAVIENVGKR